MTNVVDSEEQVLSLMLVVDEALARAAVRLHSSQFGDKTSAALFSILADLHREGGLAVEARAQEAWVRLRLRASMSASNASRYIARIICLATAQRHTAALEWHMERIEEAALRRRVVAMAETIASSAGDPTVDVVEAVRRAASELTTGMTTRDVPLIGLTASRHIEERIEPATPPVRVPIGVSALDAYLGGYEPGELIVISATPGAGKSAMAIQSAIAAANAGKSIAMFSLELSANQITLRIAANRLSIPLHAVFSGDVTREQRRELAQFANDVHSWQLAVYDVGTLKMSDIERLCDSQRSQCGLDLVIVDLLGLVRTGNNRDSRAQQLTEVAYALKALAKTLRVPVIATVQLNRLATDAPNAGMALIKDSGGPAEAADMVIVLTERKWDADEERDPSWRPIAIKLDKVRRADRRTLRVAFDGRFQKFVTPGIVTGVSVEQEDF